MFSRVFSAAVCGIRGLPVVVEADVSDGLPGFSMVGDLSAKVKEAQQRVMTAFRNSGIRLKPRRITVNLSPADVHKDGTGYDLPIALAVLMSYQLLEEKSLEGVLAVGELGLNGAVKGIRGALPVVQAARALGCHTCILPEENRAEGERIDGIRIIAVESLSEVLAWFCQGTQAKKKASEVYNIEETELPDFREINGQSVLRRAAEVAVCGRHNFLMVGPPGAGKSMLAKRLPGILPALTPEESLEVSAIYSVAGMLSEKDLLLHRDLSDRRIIPSHRLRWQGAAGFPNRARSVLHSKGFCFWMELAEFRRETLEILRQPMEDREVHISRVHSRDTFPAECMIVAATNFCKCGNFPDHSRCICTPSELRRYQSRLSRPILDRMDISVEAQRLEYKDLVRNHENEDSASIRRRVECAGEFQKRRYQGTGYTCNAQLDASGVQKYCVLGRKEERLLKEAYDRLELTARACHRIRKVARTIADMQQREQITEEDLYEAISYRMFEQQQIWR